MKITNIVFDMDGTLADFYSVPDWLKMLQAENPLPYQVANPLFDMRRLVEVLEEIGKADVKIHIVTWSAIDASASYNSQIRKAKLEWLEKFGFPYNSFHLQKYGRCKRDAIYQYLPDESLSLLIDDNSGIRQNWDKSEKYPSFSIDPTKMDIIQFLEELVKNNFEV